MPKFKVGDKVVMTKGDYIGCKGVVERIDNSDTKITYLSVRFGKPLDAYGSGPMKHMIEAYGLELVDKPDTSDWADVWEKGSE